MREINKSKKFYQGVNKQRKGYTTTWHFCFDQNEKLITNKKNVVETATIADIHRKKTQRHFNIPTIEEVNTSIHNLKNSWTFHQMLCKICITENMSKDWNESSICSIHKKGGKSFSNYRGISLLNIAYKIFVSILCEIL